MAVLPALVGGVDAHPPDDACRGAALVVVDGCRVFADEELAAGRQAGVLGLPERSLVEAPERVGVAWLVPADVQFGHARVVAAGGQVDDVTGSGCRSRGWTGSDFCIRQRAPKVLDLPILSTPRNGTESCERSMLPLLTLSRFEIAPYPRTHH